MKIRTGFISNSSSASFAIPLAALTEQQLKQILDYPRIAEQKDSPYSDRWSIRIGKYMVDADTMMDNHDIRRYLDFIGVEEEAVRFYGD